jgi:iron(III) transport system ATP-binding protein
MHDGRFTQVGPPAEVYRSPTDRRSATSLGEACFLPGQVRDGVVTCALGSFPVPGVNGFAGSCEVLIRPEQVQLGDPTETAEPAACLAEVTKAAYFGHDALVELRLAPDSDGASARGDRPTRLSARTVGLAAPSAGTRVAVRLVGTPHILPPQPPTPA